MVVAAGRAGFAGGATAVAAFGIRGVGSFYYLAYATAEAGFDGVEPVWATAGLVVVVSVVLHGVATTSIMKRLDRSRQTAPAAGIDGAGPRVQQPHCQAPLPTGTSPLGSAAAVTRRSCGSAGSSSTSSSSLSRTTSGTAGATSARVRS